MQDHPFATTPGLVPILSHPLYPVLLRFKCLLVPLLFPTLIYRPYGSSKISRNCGTECGTLGGVLLATGRGL